MPRTLTLYTRQGCHLCELMRAEVTAFLAGHDPQIGVRIDSVDIDTDVDLKERYDWRVPVLAGRDESAGDDIICEGRFDAAALQDFLDISGI